MPKVDRELAKMLYPKAADVVEEGLGARAQTSYAYGTAASDSDGGTVTVVMEGETAGVDAAIEVPTSCAISEGDTVLVSVSGNVPVEAVSKGSGEVTRAIASNAQAVADATNQHFWTDTSGIHVTEVDQETFIANPQGANQLSNSQGILLRDGTDVLASFTPSQIQLGANSQTAEIELCGGYGKITSGDYSPDGIEMQSAGGTYLVNTDTSYKTVVGGDEGVTEMTVTDDESNHLASVQAFSTDGTDWPTSFQQFESVESSGNYVGLLMDKLLFANYGLTFWENGSHNLHIRSGEDGATTQWEISIEYAGIYSRRRSRSSADAAWGAWSSWALKVSF